MTDETKSQLTVHLFPSVKRENVRAKLELKLGGMSPEDLIEESQGDNFGLDFILPKNTDISYLTITQRISYFYIFLQTQGVFVDLEFKNNGLEKAAYERISEDVYENIGSFRLS